MGDCKAGLKKLFDDSLELLPMFKRKTYEESFQILIRNNEECLKRLSDMCDRENNEEELEVCAGVIPEYAKEKLKEITSRRKKQRAFADYNMTMAVYVIPLVNYSIFHNKREQGSSLAVRMIEIWNELPVTGFTLSESSYHLIQSGFKDKLCYITTAVCAGRNLPDDCYELETLRKYRDNYLAQTESGRQLVEEYYDIAPGIVMAIGMHPDAPNIYEKLYQDYLLPCIHLIEEEKNEECRELYVDMVRDLQEKYFYS